MSLNKTHELHKRRFGRNLGVGLTLVAFIALVFGMTIAKVSSGDLVVQTPSSVGVSQ